MSTYAILGATGKVGTATCSALRQAGASVIAVVRDASKATELTAMGCEVAAADLQDCESLVKAMGSADVVQAIIPPMPAASDPHEEMRRTIEAVVSALKTTRPKRVLAISDYGAHVSRDIGMPTVFRGLEERLTELDGHKCFLRSAEHMENWFRLIPSTVTSAVLPTFRADVDTLFPTISARDLGIISANVLLRPVSGTSTQIIHAEGPRRYSSSDVGKELGDLMGRAVQVTPVPRAQWQAIFDQTTAPSLAQLLIKANDAQNEGGLVDVEPDVGVVQYGKTELREVLQSSLAP